MDSFNVLMQAVTDKMIIGFRNKNIFICTNTPRILVNAKCEN